MWPSPKSKASLGVSTKYRETGFTSVKTAGIETTFVIDAEPKFRERFEKQEEKTKM
jgi:hypothetical protein